MIFHTRSTPHFIVLATPHHTPHPLGGGGVEVGFYTFHTRSPPWWRQVWKVCHDARTAAQLSQHGYERARRTMHQGARAMRLNASDERRRPQRHRDDGRTSQPPGGGATKSEPFKGANRAGAHFLINLYFSLVIRMGSRGRKSTQSLAGATIGPVEIVQRPDTPL